MTSSSPTEHGLLLIETKATDVSQQSLTRLTDRRAKSLEKQIKKVLTQLQGALRRVKQPNVVQTSKGNLLLFEFWVYRKPIHLAVIVSEMLPDLHDCADVWEDAIRAAEREDAAVHLLDIVEIQRLCSRSATPATFFHHLTQRWLTAKAQQNLVLRASG